MANISSPPSASWDSISGLRGVPIGAVHTSVFDFGKANPVAMSAVYLECVADDTGLPFNSSGKTSNLGQYEVGDRILIPQFLVVNKGSLVKVVNKDGSDLTLPTGIGSNNSGLDKTPSTFVLNAGNAHKYRIRCVASHTVQPAVMAATSYFDKVVYLTRQQIAGQQASQLISVAHGQGVAPDIVEINFVVEVAEHGFTVGEIIPLKFITGDQGAGTSADPVGVWTTSADQTNIHFGMSGQSLYIPVADASSSINLFPDDGIFVGMQFCIRKEYPNPYKVTFAEKALPATINLESAAIPFPKSAGRILDNDMILINKKDTSATGYGSKYKIYMSQSGGNYSPAYAKVSFFQFYDPAKKALRFERTLAAYSAGQGKLVVFGKATKGSVDLAADSTAEWVAVFRWQYENTNIPYDIDTGWMPLNQQGMTYQYGLWSADSLAMTNAAKLPKKIEVLFRGKSPAVGLPESALNSVFSAANFSGSGIGYTAFASRTAQKISNSSCISYNNKRMHTTNLRTYSARGVMSVPIYQTYSGHSKFPESTCFPIDFSSGAYDYRICGYVD